MTTEKPTIDKMSVETAIKLFNAIEGAPVTLVSSSSDYSIQIVDPKEKEYLSEVAGGCYTELAEQLVCSLAVVQSIITLAN